MSEEKLEPQIRFEGFEDKWKEVNLGDNSKIIAGGTPSTKIDTYWRPKEIPWLSSGEVHKKRIYDTDDYISIEGLDNSSARWIKKHSVLIALAGQGKTRGTVAINEIPMTTNQSIAAIEPNEKIYYEFLFNNLEKRYEELRLMSAGDGSRGGLNKKLISEVNINLPQKFKEQKIIGEFLSSIDQSIEQKDNDLKKIKQFKQAMLQKMFPKEGETVPEVRFNNFVEEWEVVQLKNLLQTEFKGNAQAEKLSQGSNEYLDANRLNGGEPIRVSAPKNVSKNDILILWDGSKAGTVYFGFEGVLGSTLKAFVVNKKFYPAFIYQYLRGESYNIFTNFRTPNIPHVVRDFTKRFRVPIPSLKEQQLIGDYFESLDENIFSKQAELDKLKQFKQAMLDKMFV